MSFGGPIDSMIRSYQTNNRLLGGRKRLKDIQKEYPHKKKLESKQGHSHRADPVLESTVIQQIEQEQKRKGKRLIVTLIITLLIVSILGYWIYQADYSALIDIID